MLIGISNYHDAPAPYCAVSGVNGVNGVSGVSTYCK